MLRGVVVSHVRDGYAVLGRQVQRGSRHEDAPARERLGGVLERVPHRGVVVSHERDVRAVLGRQVQRGSRHEDAPVRLDGEPLEHQSRSGDGEELGSLLDDLENAYLAVEASKVLIFRLRRLKLTKTHSILLYGRMLVFPTGSTTVPPLKFPPNL